SQSRSGPSRAALEEREYLVGAVEHLVAVVDGGVVVVPLAHAVHAPGDSPCDLLAGGAGAGRGEQASVRERLGGLSGRLVDLLAVEVVPAVLVAVNEGPNDPCRVLDGLGGRLGADRPVVSLGVVAVARGRVVTTGVFGGRLGAASGEVCRAEARTSVV